MGDIGHSTKILYAIWSSLSRQGCGKGGGMGDKEKTNPSVLIPEKLGQVTSKLEDGDSYIAHVRLEDIPKTSLPVLVQSVTNVILSHRERLLQFFGLVPDCNGWSLAMVLNPQGPKVS